MASVDTEGSHQCGRPTRHRALNVGVLYARPEALFTSPGEVNHRWRANERSRRTGTRSVVCLTPTHISTSCFLECGGQNPAFDPRVIRLLRAGDVEQNPGPSSPGGSGEGSPMPSVPCCTCGGGFREGSSNRRLRCAEEGCETVVHQTSCTRFSRLVVNPTWRCDLHGGPPLLIRTQATEGANEKMRCAGQNCITKWLNKRQRPVVCQLCGDNFHQRCTALSRKALAEVKTKNWTWVCRKCDTSISLSSTEAEETNEETSGGDATEESRVGGSLEVAGMEETRDEEESSGRNDERTRAGSSAEESRETCCTCGKAFQERYSSRRLACAEEGCGKAVHQLSCTRISRYVCNPTWRCDVHGGPPLLTRNRPPDSASEKVKCAGGKCVRKWLKKGQRPMVCHVCSDQFHQGCTTMTRDELNEAKKQDWTWLCNKCEDAANAVPESLDPIPDVEERSAGAKSVCKESLRIMSWNADGLSTKAVDLNNRLSAEDIDVCAVQETKLRKGNRTPAFPGYAYVRTDRADSIGGGLLFLIKNSVVFEKLQEVSKEGTESSSIRVRMDKDKWVTLTNVYIPPVNTTWNVRFCPEILPAKDNSLICGDFNAHSDTWDALQPDDARGREVEMWATANELTPLNDELQPTRHNRATGNGSSPDIVFCGKEWLSACHDGWSLGEDLGSDHLPMVITLSNQVKHQPVLGARPRWRSNEWIGHCMGLKWRRKSLSSPLARSLCSTESDVLLAP